MDRIDIHMQVRRVEYQKLQDMRKGESSTGRCTNGWRLPVNTSGGALKTRISPAMPICARDKFVNTERWMTLARR